MRIIVLVVPLAIAFLTSGAAAQGKGSAEIGFDLGINIQILDDSSTEEIYLGLPSQTLGGYSALTLQTVRVGFFVTETGQIETTFGGSFFTYGGDDTFTHVGLTAEWLQNFGATDQKMRPFIKGGGAYRLMANDQDAFAQFGVRASAGLKLATGEHVAVRFEAGGARWFETTIFRGHWDVIGLVGISVFT